MKTKLKGVITALATPFTGGQIDKKSFAKLVRHQLDQGVEGFVINGTTGESPTLTRGEVKDLFNFAKSEVSGAVPLILGTGSNSTSATCDYTREVAALKPDAVLVVVPYYNRPPQRGLARHFTAVAESSDVPVILYNVPSRTVASLDVATVHELARHPNIAGIKDATGNMETFAEIKAGVPGDFALLSGDDITCVDFCAKGGHGVISVSSHVIGKEMKEYLARSTSRDDKAVGEYAERYSALMKHLYIEANPIPVKAALNWMGIFESMEARLPLVSLDEKFHKDFKACLAELGKI